MTETRKLEIILYKYDYDNFNILIIKIKTKFVNLIYNKFMPAFYHNIIIREAEHRQAESLTISERCTLNTQINKSAINFYIFLQLIRVVADASLKLAIV